MFVQKSNTPAVLWNVYMKSKMIFIFDTVVMNHAPCMLNIIMPANCPANYTEWHTFYYGARLLREIEREREREERGREREGERESENRKGENKQNELLHIILLV